MRPGAFLLLFLLPGASAAAVPAAAQEPQDTRGTDTAVAEAPSATTPRTRPAARYVPPRFSFSVTGGTLGFSDLHRQSVFAERVARDGTVSESESLRRRLTAEDGLEVSVSALFSLTPAWAVRAGATWGRARLAASYSGEEAFLADVRALRPSAPAGLSIFSAEGALRFRMRSGRPFHPYAELGLAIVRMEAEDTAFAGAATIDGSGGRLAGLAALGAVVPIRGSLVGRLQLTGQFFRTPTEAAPEGAPVASSTNLRVTFEPAAAGAFADPVLELARVFRLDAGLSIELGSMRGTRAAAAAPTTGSRP